MDKKWIEDKMWSGHGWLSQTWSGILLFNTEAVKCKHQEDIQQRSSLIYADTEDYVEIKLKHQKHLLKDFFYNFGKVGVELC